MRRLIAIVLLLLLPLQAVCAATAPYCQHEQTQGEAQDASHAGHHVHDHDALGNDLGADLDEDLVAEVTTSSDDPPVTAHDHHCCGALSLLSAPLPMLGTLPPADLVAAPVAAYALLDAPRIERPKWPAAL